MENNNVTHLLLSLYIHVNIGSYLCLVSVCNPSQSLFCPLFVCNLLTEHVFIQHKS